MSFKPRPIDDDSILPVPFIIGEIFELAALVAIYHRAQDVQFNIPVVGYRHIPLPSEVKIDEKIDFIEEKFEDDYGISLLNLKNLIETILPLTEAITMNLDIAFLSEDVKRIVEIALNHSKKARSNKNAMSDELVKKRMDYLLDPVRISSVGLTIHSGYLTGKHFIDWCNLKYQEYFVLIECRITNYTVSPSKDYYPDVMIAKEGKIVMVGDLKSYLKFILDSDINMLKNILSDLPITGLSTNYLEETISQLQEISIHDFRKRYNILLRYFKLLNYMDTIYDNFSEVDEDRPLDGIILFPTKPVYFKASNNRDIRKFRNILKKLISYEIKRYNQPSLNLKNDLRDKTGLDLEEFLLSGDFYISKVQDPEGTQRYSYRLDPDKYKNEIIELFVEGPFREKSHLVKSSLFESETGIINYESLINHQRMQHEHKLIEILEYKGSRANVIIDGSDQGAGKNYTMSEYIKKKAQEIKDCNVLFSSPRKEALLKSKEDFIKTLSMICERSVEISKNEFHFYLDHGQFKIRVSYVQSDVSTSKIVQENDILLLRRQENEGEKSAQLKLKEIMFGDDFNIEIVLVTSQTLPSFFNFPFNYKQAKNNIENTFNFFDLIIFDELTNTNPVIRETFIDSLLYYTKNNDNYRNLQFLILDASLTSPELLFDSLREILIEKVYFVPFMEKVKDYNTDHIELFDQTFDGLDGLTFSYIRYLLKYPIQYAISSIGSERTGEFVPFDQILDEIRKIVAQKQIEDQSFPDLESLLQNHQVMIYVDNKQVIDYLVANLREKKYKVAISIGEEKNREKYLTSNVVGTSSLAFGASFPNKRLMIILPPYKGVKYFESKVNVELFRQVIKRMRGGDERITRMVIFTTLPTQTEEMGLTDEVSMNFHMLSNFVKFFINNAKHHQIPPFTASLQSKHWIFEHGSSKKPLHSIYYRIRPDEANESIYMEYFLKNIVPQIKRVFSKWGLIVLESFSILFDSQNVLEGVPTPNYICYPINSKFFSNSFHLSCFPVRSDFENHMETYLKQPIDKIRSDLDLLARLCGIEEENGLEPHLRMKNILMNLLDQVKRKSNKTKKAEEINKIFNMFSFSNLRLSGTAYLFSYDLAIDHSDFFGKGNPTKYETIGINNDFIRKLMRVKSPIYSLYYGDSEYYETPVIVQFSDRKVYTVGFLTYYPFFMNTNPMRQFNQLLRKCLLRELFQPNVIYLPGLMKDFTN